MSTKLRLPFPWRESRISEIWAEGKALGVWVKAQCPRKDSPVPWHGGGTLETCGWKSHWTQSPVAGEGHTLVSGCVFLSQPPFEAAGPHSLTVAAESLLCSAVSRGAGHAR